MSDDEELDKIQKFVDGLPGPRPEDYPTEEEIGRAEARRELDSARDRHAADVRSRQWSVPIQGRDWSTELPGGERLSVDMVFDCWPPPALGLRMTERGKPDLTAAYLLDVTAVCSLEFTGKIERHTPEERAALLGTIEGLNARIRVLEARLRRNQGAP